MTQCRVWVLRDFDAIDVFLFVWCIMVTYGVDCIRDYVFQRMEDGETPESLYRIAALLISHNLVDIDKFYPHVSTPSHTSVVFEILCFNIRHMWVY